MSRTTTPFDLRVEGGRPLRGDIRVPADKSILHRALMLAGIAKPDGPSTIRALLPGDDNLSTAEVMRSLGADINHQRQAGTENRGTPAYDEFVVHGIGLDGDARGLRQSHPGPTPTALECGNSGTTMRLLAGLLAGAGAEVELSGDQSLSRRPMTRVTAPLRAMGATISGEQDEHGKETAPLRLRRSADFIGGHYTSPVASAQIKSALLLAAIGAGQDVCIEEPAPSRDHSERMLRALGYPCVSGTSPTGLPQVDMRLSTASIRTGHSPFELTVPGDISSAAFALVAALITPESDVTVRSVGLNPTRTGLLDVLQEMNAGAVVSDRHEDQGEAVGSIQCRYQTDLRVPQPELRVGDALIPRLIDELVVLAALFSRAHGRVRVSDANELRVKESDRIAEIERLLSGFGRHFLPTADGFVIEGRPAAEPGTDGPILELDVSSDHRVALTGLVLALARPGTTVLRGFDIAAVSYPSVVNDFTALGARLTLC